MRIEFSTPKNGHSTLVFKDLKNRFAGVINDEVNFPFVILNALKAFYESEKPQAILLTGIEEKFYLILDSNELIINTVDDRVRDVVSHRYKLAITELSEVIRNIIFNDVSAWTRWNENEYLEISRTAFFEKKEALLDLIKEVEELEKEYSRE